MLIELQDHRSQCLKVSSKSHCDITECIERNDWHFSSVTCLMLLPDVLAQCQSSSSCGLNMYKRWNYHHVQTGTCCTHSLRDISLSLRIACVHRSVPGQAGGKGHSCDLHTIFTS